MVRFGVQLWQEEFDFESLKKAWREVEEMGYDSAWLYDHFYPMSSQTSSCILEPWSLLPSLAAETSRLRLGILVTCNSYRIPSVLAKIAASVDVMTGGRLEFGIGAGWHEDEYNAYGIPFPNLGTRIEQLAEAVEIIKRIWTQETATFQGKHYAIKDLAAYPKPVQKPHIPIWIGGRDKRLLKIIARRADHANLAGCPVEVYRKKLAVLRKHCIAVERNYEEVKKTWHGTMILIDKEESRRRQILRVKESSTNMRLLTMSFEDYSERLIAGTPEQCVEKIQRYVDLGVTYFIPHFPFAQDLKALRTFMEKVAAEFERG